MKTLSLFTLAIFLCLFWGINKVYSQNEFINRIAPVVKEVKFEKNEELSDYQRKQIHTRIDSTVNNLIKIGKINKVKAAQAHPLFILPLKQAEGYSDYGFFVITEYVDHDVNFPNHLKDYNCGQITYDLSEGYNHTGTDFGLFPFGWNKMNNDEVEVVAAAPGVIVDKNDGNFDKNCSFTGSNWNAISLRHSDGSISWYGHLKKNSLTTKNIGDYMNSGEYLGTVGSSGNSTGPHLHFEVCDAYGSLIDPFSGACSTADSWWIDQLQYKKSGINHIGETYTMPIFGSCPNEDEIYETVDFWKRDSIYLFSYITNLSVNDTIFYKLYQPDGSLLNSWKFISSWEYNAAWVYYYFILGNSYISGTYTININYKGKSYTQYFNLDYSTSVSFTNSPRNISIYPNPTSDNEVHLKIENCNANFIDVCIYNILGCEVFRERYNSVSKTFNENIQLNNLTNGVYNLQISDGKSKTLKKLLINNLSSILN
jgi:hypothetical protein